MSSINPSIPTGSQVFQEASDARDTARRLTTAARVHAVDRADRSVTASQSDTVELGSLDLSRETDKALDRVGRLLDQLRRTVEQSADSTRNADKDRARLQNKVDRILESISEAADAGSLRELAYFGGGDVRLEISGGIQEARVLESRIPDGETRTIDASIESPAQPGALLLSFGGATLDLSQSGKTFQFVVRSATGVQEFAFASSTTLSDVAGAISSFRGQTGVSAVVDGTGIRIESDSTGPDSFVSVGILGNAVVNAQNAGIYDLDDGTLTDFIEGASRSDSGENVRVRIGDEILESIDGSVRYATGEFTVDLDFTESAANGTGPFNGGILTLVGDADANEWPGSILDVLGVVPLPSAGAPTNLALRDLASGGSLNLIDGDRELALEAILEAMRELDVLRSFGSTSRAPDVGPARQSGAVDLLA